MEIVLDRRWEGFVRHAVASGQFASAEDVVTEGLRLVKLRDDKIHALKATVTAARTEGGFHEDADIDAAIEDMLRGLPDEIV